MTIYNYINIIIHWSQTGNYYLSISCRYNVTSSVDGTGKNILHDSCRYMSCSTGILLHCITLLIYEWRLENGLVGYRNRMAQPSASFPIYTTDWRRKTSRLSYLQVIPLTIHGQRSSCQIGLFIRGWDEGCLYTVVNM